MIAEPLLALWPLAGVAQAVLLGRNLVHFQALPPGGAGAADVAALVPARDEAGRIGPCVAAVLRSTGVSVALHVLDDGSTDGTAAEALATAAGDARLTVHPGGPLPPGWTGKNHACHQLAAAAQADWLAFLDADTRLAPEALARAVALAEATGAELVSLFPRQEVGSWAEALVLPLLSFHVLAYLPLALSETFPEPGMTAANGQFLLFSREGYARCGGHAAVRADVVDDMALARAVKRAGGRVVLRDGSRLVSCRMYADFASVWAGFRKNLFPAFGGRTAPFLAGMALIAALHALPLPLMFLGLGLGWPALALAAGAQLGLGVALRLEAARRLGDPAWSALAHPLGTVLVLAIAAASWRGWRADGVAWKGRTYGGSG